MRIECVIVSKNYADFLEHTLPDTISQVDRAVVVTHPDDHGTKQLCNRYGVDYLETTVFHDQGDQFNKGRAINLGLSHLRNDGWLLHLDADIMLPHRFKEMLAHARLDESCLYGADRLNVHGYEHWEENKHKRQEEYSWRYLVNAAEEFKMGSRLIHMEYGYCPIGYFQLWHSKMRRKYPVISGSAEHSDVLFAVQWERAKRRLLPELYCYHLESERCEMGKNWNGRKTKPFGPKCGKSHHHHKRHPHHGGYCPK